MVGTDPDTLKLRVQAEQEPYKRLTKLDKQARPVPQDGIIVISKTPLDEYFVSGYGKDWVKEDVLTWGDLGLGSVFL